MLRILSRSGTPAMRARGRILLKRIEAGKELPVITGPLPRTPGRAAATGRDGQKAGRKTLQALRYGSSPVIN